MKILTSLLCILLAPFLVISCESTQESDGPENGAKAPISTAAETFYLRGEPQWNSPADAKKFFGLSSQVSVNGTTIDLKGNRLSGKKLKHFRDSNNERSQPLKITYDNFNLRNGNIDDIPGGIVVRGNKARFTNLTFTTKGEDYVSTLKDTADGIIIEGCKFYNRGGDKSIQLNSAKNAIIDSCYITGGQTAIRLQESTSKWKNIKCYVTNTTFEKVPTAINVDGYTTLNLSGNKFISVPEKYKKGPNAKIKENQ